MCVALLDMTQMPVLSAVPHLRLCSLAVCVLAGQGEWLLVDRHRLPPASQPSSLLTAPVCTPAPYAEREQSPPAPKILLRTPASAGKHPSGLDKHAAPSPGTGTCSINLPPKPDPKRLLIKPKGKKKSR